MGELLDAEKHYTHVLRVNPHDPEASRAIKDIAADSTYKDIASRGDSYRDQLKSSARAANLEAKQHIIRSEDDFKKALAIALEEMEQNPSDSKRHRKIGDLYFNVKDYANALKYFEKATEVNPQDLYAKDKVADVRLARYEDAIKKASEVYRTDPSEKNLAAVKKAKRAKLEYSIEEWARRVEAHPTDMALRYELGTLYFKTKRYDDAIVHLQKSVGDPNVATRAHHFLGLSFVNNKLYELGIQEFRKALDGMGAAMDEQKKEVTYNLARTLEVMGKHDESLENFREILAEDYMYKDVKDRVTAVKTQLGKKD